MCALLLLMSDISLLASLCVFRAPAESLLDLLWSGFLSGPRVAQPWLELWLMGRRRRRWSRCRLNRSLLFCCSAVSLLLRLKGKICLSPGEELESSGADSCSSSSASADQPGERPLLRASHLETICCFQP